MQLLKSTGFFLFMGSFQLAAAAPANDPVLTLNPGNPSVPTGIPILTKPGGVPPPVCTGKCVTATETVTSKGCKLPTDLACPMYIKITTISVPCNNGECCTKTPTRTVTNCPTGCVIPTETHIVTTACPVATVVPIPSEILTVPPVTWSTWNGAN